MWLDWSFSKAMYLRGRAWRLATTKPSKVEKRFEEVFGRAAVLTGSKFVREGSVALIKNLIRDIVQEWKVADDNYRIAHQNFARTLGNILSFSSGRNGFDLRLVHADLEALDNIRLQKWQAAEEACRLPTEVGYKGIPTDVLYYLFPEQSSSIRNKREHAQGRLPLW